MSPLSPKTHQIISLLRQSGISVFEKDGAIVIDSATDSEVIKVRQICESVGKVFDVKPARSESKK